MKDSLEILAAARTSDMSTINREAFLQYFKDPQISPELAAMQAHETAPPYRTRRKKR
jgi:hypothetical protein